MPGLRQIKMMPSAGVDFSIIDTERGLPRPAWPPNGLNGWKLPAGDGIKLRNSRAARIDSSFTMRFWLSAKRF